MYEPCEVIELGGVVGAMLGGRLLELLKPMREVRGVPEILRRDNVER